MYPISNNFLVGQGPCFVTIDKTRNLLFIANYGNGSLDVFSLNNDGYIKNSIYYKKYSDTSRIHHIAFSNDNNILFAVDLGDNILYSYEIIYDGMNLTLKDLASYNFPIDSMPRHLVVDNEILYVVTEKSCELYKLSFSEDTGFNLIDHMSILPQNISKKENYTGCAIKISKDHKYIYTTIRGHNSISVFKITESLELIQNISCFGDTPRDINFDDSENYLLCANQNSGDISIFDRNKKTGYLTLKSSYPIDSPACIILL